MTCFLLARKDLPRVRNAEALAARSSLGNANGAMVGLILRLSIAAESFTSYVQISEEALAGAVTGNAPPRRLARFPTALSRLFITNFEKQPV